MPPSPDQFELTYVAWRLNQGAAPYDGVIDMNWPGGFWLHQLIAWLPQGPMYPWRVLDFALAVAAAAATARWLRPALGPAAAAAVLFGYPLLYADPRGYWFAGQRDAVCFHLTLLAAACQIASMRKPGGRGLAAAAGTGALVALAVLVKPLAIVAAPALVVHGLLGTGSAAEKARRVGLNLAGGLAVLAAAAIGLALQGAPWRETVDAAWTYNLTGQRDNALPASTLARDALAYGLGGWKLLLPVAFVLLAWTTFRGDRRSPAADARRLAWVFLPAAVAFYWLQGKGFVYHLAWVQGVVFVTALAAAGVATATAARGFARGRMAVPRPVSVVCLLLAAAAAAGVLAKAAAYRVPLGLVTGATSRPDFLARYNAGPGTTFAEAERLAAELAAAAPPGEDPEDHPVLVFGDAVSINLLSGRPLPTAFYYPRVLAAMHHGGEASGDLPARWDARFAEELRASRPGEVFVGENVYAQLEAADAPARAVLDAWLAERYRPAGRVGGLLRFARTGN